MMTVNNQGEMKGAIIV